MGLGVKVTLGTIAFLTPFTFWMGVRNWTTMAVVLGQILPDSAREPQAE